MIDIGRVGLWTGVIDAHTSSEVRDLVQQIEGMGWPTLWRPETTGRDALVSSALMLEATTRLKIATGIAQTFARHPHTAVAGQHTLNEQSGGRFLLGLGVSHAPHVIGSRKLEYRTPYQDMVNYLAAMAESPFTSVKPAEPSATVLAALGPKMLKLSATAAHGAHPYFSPVEHTAFAREILGSGPLLAPEQMVVLDTDAERGRETAVLHMTRYLTLPNYTNNLRRFGFTDEDFAGPSQRVIDAVVAIGDIDTIVERVDAQHAAGADHVCIQVLTNNPRPAPIEAWQRLADAFGLGG
jgi:probable F420-dependent oxidoreductase